MKVVVNSDTSSAGSRLSSGSEKALRSEWSDCCSESLGAEGTLRRQALLGIAGRPLHGGYGG